MAFIVGTMVVIAMFAFLMRGNVAPPEVMSESQLRNEGMTPQQIRGELRRQRAEFRARTHAESQAMRTSLRAGRMVMKAMNKKPPRVRAVKSQY